MRETGFRCLFQLVYLLMGLVQWSAILEGIKVWWEWPWWIAIFVALPIAYTPILGTVVGIMGAIESFGWSPMAAITFFCWPYIIYIVAIVIVGAGELFSLFRK